MQMKGLNPNGVTEMNEAHVAPNWVTPLGFMMTGDSLPRVDFGDWPALPVQWPSEVQPAEPDDRRHAHLRRARRLGC
jgi:hypothetical protein